MLQKLLDVILLYFPWMLPVICAIAVGMYLGIRDGRAEQAQREAGEHEYRKYMFGE